MTHESSYESHVLSINSSLSIQCNTNAFKSFKFNYLNFDLPTIFDYDFNITQLANYLANFVNNQRANSYASKYMDLESYESNFQRLTRCCCEFFDANENKATIGLT